jgi:hypothetical protein
MVKTFNEWLVKHYKLKEAQYTDMAVQCHRQPSATGTGLGHAEEFPSFDDPPPIWGKAAL